MTGGAEVTPSGCQVGKRWGREWRQGTSQEVWPESRLKTTVSQIRAVAAGLVEFWRQNHGNLMMDWMWHERDQSGMSLNLSESKEVALYKCIYTQERQGGVVCVCKSKGRSILDTVQTSGS